MKFLATIICVVCVLLFVQSEQVHEKFKEAFCKLQCYEKNSSACFASKDCKCDPGLIPNLDSMSMTAYGKSEPRIKCKSEDMIFVEWNDDFNPFHRKNITVYFLHVKSNHHELFTDVIFCHYANITGLSKNTSYSVSLWGVDDASNVFVSRSVNIRTNERKKEPLRVSNITVALKPQPKYYEADLKWTPSTELACFYEVAVLRMDFSFSTQETSSLKIYDIVPTPELFKFRVKELEFGGTYHIMIKTRGSNWEHKSESKRLSFHVPTCLAAHKNLSICAPAKPENLTITEIPSPDVDEIGSHLFDIQLEWSKPLLVPDYYIAELLIFNNTYHVMDTINKNVSGEAVNATFKKLKLDASFQANLQAISSGGKSIRATSHRFLEVPEGLPPSINGKTNVTKIPRSFRNEKIMNVVIGMVSILSVFGISSIILIICTSHKQCNSKQRGFDEKVSDIESVVATFHQIAEPDKWEIPYETLNIQGILGEGNFGVVWRALLQEKPVACKILKENSTIDEKRQLQQEIELMKNVGSHPNIVSMIGCVTQGVPNGPILIVEYCSMGNLLNYLRSIYDPSPNIWDECHENVYSEERKIFVNKTYELNFSQTESAASLSYKDVLSFGRQIAQGMEYLSNQKILHRDLAARNILMCEDKMLKVSDFGLSRDVYMENIYRKTSDGKLPLRWMALESLTHQIYSTQSDVWSFGVLLWEIVSFGGIPYPGVEAESLTKLLKQGYRLSKPPLCHDKVYSIMKDCWKESPKDRPTFKDLKEAFDVLLAQEANYLELVITT